MTDEVTIIVATYGDTYWRLKGEALAGPVSSQPVMEAIFLHQDDGTLASCRNAAAGKSTADWLCFLDADDQLDPGYMHAMAPEIWAASHYFQPTLFGEEGEWHRQAVPLKLLAPAVSYVELDGSASIPSIPNAGRWPDLNTCVIGTLVPSMLFHAVGGFRELPSLEDYDLFLRCVKAGAVIRHVPDAVYLAASGARRNADQSCYQQLRTEHAEVWT